MLPSMFAFLPKDILEHVLYPFMHEESLERCIKNYHLIEVIESHPNFDKNKAMLFASRYGHIDLVKYFISLGANVLHDNNYAILSATINGHLNVVKYLLASGIDKKRCGVAFQYACELGHLDIVKCLMDESFQRVNPLNGACENGHLDVVKYLISEQRLQSISSPYFVSMDRHQMRINNALWIAIKHKRHNVAKYLDSIGTEH